MGDGTYAVQKAGCMPGAKKLHQEFKNFRESPLDIPDRCHFAVVPIERDTQDRC
jgi:hypothetical protein